MKGLKIFTLLVFLLIWNVQFAQETETDDEKAELSLEEGTIDSQFEYVFKKSGDYRSEGKRYEVVRTVSLEKLRQNVSDSLKASTKTAAELRTTITGHESTVSTLNKKLEETTNNLSAVTEEKDSMSFLGILVSKVTYNTILWSIIAGLLGLMLFFMYKFRRSNILTQKAKTDLGELETEYEDHRRRALEREQKISRQLQDEINKYKKTK